MTQKEKWCQYSRAYRARRKAFKEKCKAVDPEKKAENQRGYSQKWYYKQRTNELTAQLKAKNKEIAELEQKLAIAKAEAEQNAKLHTAEIRGLKRVIRNYLAIIEKLKEYLNFALQDRQADAVLLGLDFIFNREDT